MGVWVPWSDFYFSGVEVTKIEQHDWTQEFEDCSSIILLPWSSAQFDQKFKPQNDSSSFCLDLRILSTLLTSLSAFCFWKLVIIPSTIHRLASGNWSGYGTKKKQKRGNERAEHLRAANRNKRKRKKRKAVHFANPIRVLCMAQNSQLFQDCNKQVGRE